MKVVLQGNVWVSILDIQQEMFLCYGMVYHEKFLSKNRCKDTNFLNRSAFRMIFFLKPFSILRK